MIARTTGHVETTSVKTRVKGRTLSAVKGPCVKFTFTGQSASAQPVGLALLTRSVINVSNGKSTHMRGHHPDCLNIADECQKDADCPLTKACVNKKCTDPCHHTRCGQGALCEVEYHLARCKCPPGQQGNPIIQCIRVGCLRDEDCDQKEKCDYASQRCIPLCVGQPCATGADCIAHNHKEDCRCNPPLQGDGFGFCQESKRHSFVLGHPLFIVSYTAILFLPTSSSRH